jgi:serine/threonine-protein kinase RsbW/stage II sporulation protein AB (anti-sigma F factor)
LDAVKLAVSEAVTNAVLHAYLDRPEPGIVRVTAHNGAGTIRIVVADEGRGMLARSDSPGLGCGLRLLGLMAPGCDVRPGELGGTEVHMSFAVGSPKALG